MREGEGEAGVSAPRAVSNVSFHALLPSSPLSDGEEEAKVHNNEERGSEESRGKWILSVSAEGEREGVVGLG